MAYVKNTWTTGDVVTATKLNNIEDGIEEAAQSGGGVLYLTAEEQGSSLVLSATFQEIEDAFHGGSLIALLGGDSYGDDEYQWSILMLSRITAGSGQYEVVFDGSEYFTTSSRSGYPSQSSDPPTT